jgi:hypothetical protein
MYLVLLGAVTFFSSCNDDKNLTISTVTTESVYTITVNEATCRGFVDKTAVKQFTNCGICWSTNANPTISDSSSMIDTSLKEFTCTMHGLISDTPYYVRAFANIGSEKVEYGNVLTFRTPKIPDFGMVTIQSGTYLMGGLTGMVCTVMLLRQIQQARQPVI